jgi:protein ImuB
VARFAAGYDGREVCIIPAGGTAAALAPLPVAGLRLPPAVVQDLDRIGLRSIAALKAMPRAPLAARFGNEVLKRLDQALGEADEPLSPRRPVPAMIARLAFAEPIGHLDDVVRAAVHLIKDLCARLAQAHQGARRLELALYLIDGTVSRAAIGASRPTRDPVHLQRLFREKLGLLNAGFGIEVATLAAPEVEPLAAIQMPLTASRSEPWRSESLARLIDRLVNRLGADNVNRFVRQASHIPERACREDSVTADGGNKRTAGGRQDKGTGPAGDQQSRQPRPLILLPWPEPIEVVVPVPDDPPVMFRRGRRQHRVSTAVGPERIASEWWREDRGLDPLRLARIRDYYRIEDSDGGRFWIYREDLYRPDIPARWYLHGLFP